jgi:glycosyltransferase involved in cell wall biosynthesis
MPKISIVSAYYNRKDLLWRSIMSIKASNFKDFEYVLVDDASDDEHRIEDFASLYPFIKLIRINPKEKTWTNPCVPFNIGFSQAKGDYIIIQNPECVNMGDVLSYVNDKLTLNKYLVFACYSLGQASTNKLRQINLNTSIEELVTNVSSALGGFLPRSCDEGSRFESWFSHPEYRKCFFNFLTAITKEDLYDLGGFDEEYANGFAYDDTDFAMRIVKKNMDIEMVASPFCLHQYHTSSLEQIPNLRAKEQLNKSLYEIKSASPDYKVITNRLIRS